MCVCVCVCVCVCWGLGGWGGGERESSEIFVEIFVLKSLMIQMVFGFLYTLSSAALKVAFSPYFYKV